MEVASPHFKTVAKPTIETVHSANKPINEAFRKKQCNKLNLNIIVA